MTPIAPPETPSATAPRRVGPTLVTWLGITLAVVVPMLTLLSPVAVSVATGAILAVLCYPVYARVRRRMPSWIAGIVVTLGLLVLVLAPLSLLVVGGIRQGAALFARLSNDDAPTITELIERLRRWLPISDALGTPAEIQVLVKDGLGSLSQSASLVLLETARAIPLILIHLVIVALATYFLLVDGWRLYRWISGKLPLSSQIRETLVESFRVATNAVVLASVAAAGVQSLLLLITLLILGVPSALFAAGAAFVLAWIPPIGSSPVWISASIYLYLSGFHGRAGVMLGAGLLIGLIDNVVRPLVLRGRQEMHPLLSLLAILGGLGLMGLPGLFIGPLLASMTIAVLDLWPSVASYCGIPVSGAGEAVPDVPMLGDQPWT